MDESAERQSPTPGPPFPLEHDPCLHVNSEGHPERDARAPAPAGPARHRGDGIDIRILVVDDLTRARSIVTSVVEELGHEVVGEASDGAEAIDQAATLRPDVVVMDFHMPVMDGLEATRLLKLLHPEMQIIAYTSADDPEIQSAFLDAGACDHLDKGDIHGLIAALQDCAGRHRRA